MNESCGCCEGLEPLTPQSTANRPGLEALVYRVGTHATFLETMKARLSSSEFPALANLKTRDANDPAIALLDAWATVADVLTFYQERIANEGYLRTATERRSVLELARLVGYTLRPGVAATVFPAFMMEIGYNDRDSKIPEGTRVQSVPGPGEMPQFFETSEKIAARTNWNEIKPRLSRPQIINQKNAPLVETIYLKGISTNLKSGDPILLTFRFETTDVNSAYPEPEPVLRQVAVVESKPVENLTKVTLQPEPLDNNSFIKAFEYAVDKYSQLNNFCIDENSQMAAPILNLLEELIAKPSPEEVNEEVDLGLVLLRRVLQFSINIDSADGELLKKRNALFLAVFNLKKYNTESIWLNRLLTELERLVRSWYFGLRNDPRPIPGTNILIKPEVLSWANWLQKLNESSPQQTLDWYLAWLASRQLDLNSDNSGIPSDSTIQSLKIPEIIPSFDRLSEFVGPLAKSPSLPPANRFRLARNLGKTFNADSDLRPRLVETLDPRLGANLYQTLASGDRAPSLSLKTLEVMRVKASLFGHNAPLKPIFNDGRFAGNYEEWPLTEQGFPDLFSPNMVTLDALYDQIQIGSWVVIIENEESEINPLLFYKIINTQAVSVARFGMSGKVTRLFLEPLKPARDPWVLPREGTKLNAIRNITIYAQGEGIDLAEEPLTSEFVCGQTIELGTIYEGLKAGRWSIVSGERADVPNAKVSELVMLAGVQNPEPEPAGAKPYSTLTLSTKLAYVYKRDTVIIYGNVVKATHGETRTEVLGSGDGSQAFQHFPLRQPPLTYLSAPTPSGAISTLQLRVNDVLWYETDSLAGLKPTDRLYTNKTDDDGMTTVSFGNGENGARLPTGVENIRAVYRNGIGKPGNVKAEQISQLATRPLGLKGVINPLPATGGADRENRDLARKHAPLAVMSLDRLVSVQDYADFARTFAGIGKASAQRLSDGNRQIVHVTIAGSDDIPIDERSDLYRNLKRALLDFGDPSQPLQLAVRKLRLLILAAKVQVLPDYRWESVEPRIRDALLDTFSFDHREFGQNVWLSEAISVIQQVQGVAYVDVDLFNSVSEEDIRTSGEVQEKRQLVLKNAEGEETEIEIQFNQEKNNLAIKLDGLPQKAPLQVVKASLAKIDPKNRAIVPAQLAIFSPNVADTIILTELKP